MHFNIRSIEKGDNAILANLIRKAFDEYDAPKTGTVYSDPTTDDLYQLFQEDKAVLWVAETNGVIDGCCGVYPTEGLPQGCAELVKFYLAKQSRGRGVGKQLMEKSIASAKEFGYLTLYIESLPQFGTAVSMYEKWGFDKIDHPLGTSGHTSCDIWMIKKI